MARATCSAFRLPACTSDAGRVSRHASADRSGRACPGIRACRRVMQHYLERSLTRLIDMDHASAAGRPFVFSRHREGSHPQAIAQISCHHHRPRLSNRARVVSWPPGQSPIRRGAAAQIHRLCLSPRFSPFGIARSTRSTIAMRASRALALVARGLMPTEPPQWPGAWPASGVSSDEAPRARPDRPES
jgi:hypothetical protein